MDTDPDTDSMRISTAGIQSADQQDMSTCAHLEVAALDRVLHAEADLDHARRRVAAATRRPFQLGLDGALIRLRRAEATLASAQSEHLLLQSLVHHETQHRLTKTRRHLGLIDIV
jgi:hypothetical protein